jgi:hypothetical protein
MEVKIKEFDSIMQYLDWHSEQYQNQTGIKVCGLRENGDRMVAEYIELF